MATSLTVCGLVPQPNKMNTNSHRKGSREFKADSKSLQIAILISKTPLPNTETIIFPSLVIIYGLSFYLPAAAAWNACSQIPIKAHRLQRSAVGFQVEKRKKAEGRGRRGRCRNLESWDSFFFFFKS